ncbi:MAG TPA: AbrB/MazE/SpoVT family DNA-binding domain-containing protein [Verrucomicrobiae bacterium]|nr:AbrB/MazE/SpoVT family DNA-binding domain-containing protein [Verrucomicrobiae bacterium]
MATETQIAKWGNSLAVRIPRGIAREARFAEGDRLSLDLATDGSVVMRSKHRKYSLDQLVRQIKKGNRHRESSFGPPQGLESW